MVKLEDKRKAPAQRLDDCAKGKKLFKLRLEKARADAVEALKKHQFNSRAPIGKEILTSAKDAFAAIENDLQLRDLLDGAAIIAMVRAMFYEPGSESNHKRWLDAILNEKAKESDSAATPPSATASAK